MAECDLEELSGSQDTSGMLKLVCHEEVEGYGHFFAVQAGSKMAACNASEIRALKGFRRV